MFIFSCCLFLSNIKSEFTYSVGYNKFCRDFSYRKKLVIKFKKNLTSNKITEEMKSLTKFTEAG